MKMNFEVVNVYNPCEEKFSHNNVGASSVSTPFGKDKKNKSKTRKANRNTTTNIQATTNNVYNEQKSFISSLSSHNTSKTLEK
jgi:hypothetical protein